VSISLRNITKRFGKKTVIENLSLDFESDSRTAIVAFSGSGKTTLFRIMAGLEKRFEGEVIHDGKLALMFQEDRLFEKATVLENVTAVSDKPKEEAVKLLTELGLGDSLHLFPTALSGGMKRRVALARALFFDAQNVLLDECFTGLDDDTKKQTAEVINKYTQGKTLILITHSREEARLLNCRLLIFEKGFIF